MTGRVRVHTEEARKRREYMAAWKAKQSPEKLRAEQEQARERRKQKLRDNPDIAATTRAARARYQREQRARNKERYAAYARTHRASHRGSKTKWLQKATWRAKHRAEDRGYAFDLCWRDIEAPDACPILGTPLKYEMGTRCDASPSLDKIIPAKGYVKGNVWVISNLANRLKSDATPEQLMRVALAVADKVGHG